MTREEFGRIIDYSNFMIDSNNPYDMKILEALEKQVPKKVTHEATLHRSYTCPCCKNVVEEFIDFRGMRTLVQVNRCKFCGQALLW